MIAATMRIGQERRGLAAGLLSTSQQLGGGIGAALAAIIGASATLPSYRTSLTAFIALLGIAAMIVGTRFASRTEASELAHQHRPKVA